MVDDKVKSDVILVVLARFEGETLLVSSVDDEMKVDLVVDESMLAVEANVVLDIFDCLDTTLDCDWNAEVVVATVGFGVIINGVGVDDDDDDDDDGFVIGVGNVSPLNATTATVLNTGISNSWRRHTN